MGFVCQIRSIQVSALGPLGCKGAPTPSPHASQVFSKTPPPWSPASNTRDTPPLQLPLALHYGDPSVTWHIRAPAGQPTRNDCRRSEDSPGDHPTKHSEEWWWETQPQISPSLPTLECFNIKQGFASCYHPVLPSTFAAPLGVGSPTIRFYKMGT